MNARKPPKHDRKTNACACSIRQERRTRRASSTPEALSGVEVASLLDLDPDRVFKTLVTQAKSGEHYVFMIPVACELDLKKAAAAVGEKAVAMLPARELLPLTGYVHGGCSPIGMRRPFPTAIDETPPFERIAFSGGRIDARSDDA
ncbi:MAG: aminoacyl-tRNA deacylase [Eggerthellaceae bacterium]